MPPSELLVVSVASCQPVQCQSFLMCIRESHCSHEDPHIPPAKVPGAEELQPWTGHDRPNGLTSEAPNHIAPFCQIRPRSLHQVPNGSNECGQSSGHLRQRLNSIKRGQAQLLRTHLCQKDPKRISVHLPLVTVSKPTLCCTNGKLQSKDTSQC